MSIVKEIDKLSGTDTRSRNITQAIDKLTGKGPSKNIGDAIRKMKKDTPTEKLLMTGGAYPTSEDQYLFNIVTDEAYTGKVKFIFNGYKYKGYMDSDFIDDPNAIVVSDRAWSIDPEIGYNDDGRTTYLPDLSETYITAWYNTSTHTQYTDFANENPEDRSEDYIWDSVDVYSVEE